MDLISQVTLLGGVCSRTTLLRLRPSAEVKAAVRDGVLVKDARGRYALPSAQPALRLAGTVGGVVSHRSAAQHWGWAQKAPPEKPEITFRRDRHLDPALRKVLVPHWCELRDGDVTGLVTSPARTLVDCMRNLPFDEALAIVHSAVRADDVTVAEVRRLADSTRGRGRARIRAVAAATEVGVCTNPFEAVLYAQALLVPGLDVVPQLAVVLPDGRVLHPDVADPVLGVAFEAESFEWHGEPAALTRDCRRYNALMLLGWQVIRFSWYQVMFEPAYVQRVLREAVAARRASVGHANVA